MAQCTFDEVDLDDLFNESNNEKKLREMLQDSCDIIHRLQNENKNLKGTVLSLVKLRNKCQTNCNDCDDCIDYNLKLRVILLKSK